MASTRCNAAVLPQAVSQPSMPETSAGLRAGKPATTAMRERSSSNLHAGPLVAVSIGFAMAVLDVTIVNVAASHIQSALHMDLRGLLWVVDGYTLAFAALLLAGGGMANRHGSRAAYLAGLFIFMLGSLFCAASVEPGMLVGARLLQGVGAALFMPASLGLLTQAYEDEAVRRKAVGIWTAIVSAAAAMGPFVGGALVSAFGWRSIFWVNVPFSLLGIVLTLQYIRRSPTGRHESGIAGHLSAIGALSGLAYALINGVHEGWLSCDVLIAAGISLLSALAFVAHERLAAKPIIPVALRRQAHFSAANGVGLLLCLAGYGQFFLVSLYLQQSLGLSAWYTGLSLLPLMVAGMLANLASARISSRYDLRASTLLGAGVSIVAGVVLVAWPDDLPLFPLTALMCLYYAGIGLAMPAMTAAIMQAAGRKHANIAAATLNANRQSGVLIGVALAGGALHVLPAWRTALPTATAILGTGLLLAFLLAWRYMGTPVAQKPIK